MRSSIPPPGSSGDRAAARTLSPIDGLTHCGQLGPADFRFRCSIERNDGNIIRYLSGQKNRIPSLRGAVVGLNFEAAKSACGQCPHFGLRIASYVGRIGPDSVCFRGSPGFAGPGMQFESHLGHSVSAGQGPIGASDCAQIFFYRPLRGRCWAGWLHSLGSATLGWLLLHGRSWTGRLDLLGCVVRNIFAHLCAVYFLAVMTWSGVG
jgi:hypothetical protein